MAGSGRSAKIDLFSASALICEASVAEQDVLAAMLGGFGLNRIQRSDSPRQLPHVAKQKFDLIFVGVTAVTLREMDGIAALRRAVDHPCRTAPIVVMSSHTPLTMIERAREVGATFVLAKPLCSQVVFDRILWLATNTRQFVETESFFGPDRRTRNYGPPLGLPGRREGDLSAFLDDEAGENMSQDAIDHLIKPMKFTL